MTEAENHYTSRKLDRGAIGVRMPGCEYILDREQARRLRDSLSSVLEVGCRRPSDIPANICLGWQLRVLAAKRDIRNAAELSRRLAGIGYDISPAQVSRIMDERPAQIKTALVEAICEVLQCSAAELLPLTAVGNR